MILILISWVYIFFTSIIFGIASCNVLRISKFELVTTTFIGLFSITVLASVWAFFNPISVGFHIILVFFTLLFWYKNKTLLITILTSTHKEIKSFVAPFKLLFLGFSLLVLAQSATLPFIYDNETYYVQTIKWLNEYGFVPGLANLHLFLGQTSGWHITQSVYSFSFFYDRFNDLNGFCLLLVNYFAFQKLHSYFLKGNTMDLIFGLVPLTYSFLFQFVSAPSPDFAVCLLAFLVFSLFLDEDVVKSKTTFSIITLLALFAFYCKVTAVVLLLFPVIFALKHFQYLKKRIVLLLGLSCFVLVLFVIKNCWLTGYPFFPLLTARMDVLEYSVPPEIMNFFFSKGMMNSFYISNKAYGGATVLEIVKQYFLYNGLSSLIGIFSVLTLFIIPIVIIKKQLPKSLWTIYTVFIILILLLTLSSPQYRFYVYFTLFFLQLMLSLWITNQKWIFRLYTLSLILVIILVTVPLSYKSLTDNDWLTKNCTLHWRNIFIPEPNSKWVGDFKKTSIGNMPYYSPKDNSNFWLTSNGNLPCVNSVQLEYFQKGFSFIPQQRSTDVIDGFFSQKVSNYE
ncbi:hypothetical protein [Flavobacterium sp.]|uniref:LIC_10190 family membrane protein n=1 Tax=Flavobacterium sp. TaxID=239 RepID=UPI0025ED3094|nr:hypothetical protein [Flavobacterium sp.]